MRNFKRDDHYGHEEKPSSYQSRYLSGLILELINQNGCECLHCSYIKMINSASSSDKKDEITDSVLYIFSIISSIVYLLIN